MIPREESNRRLRVLADFLRDLPTKRFDYQTWVGDEWRGAQDLSCGTVACAGGWACTIPEFRALGLHLGRNGTPRLYDEHGVSALRYVFGLDSEEAGHLFFPDTEEEFKSTSAYVAEKIERFIQSRK